MTKYDKIWAEVPTDQEGKYAVINGHPCKLKSLSGGIVLTIEELKEVLKDGYDEGRSSVYLEFDDFKGVWEQFLKRKGIQI